MSNGLDTVCLVKKLLDRMSGLVVLFYFPLFLFQREFKYDMDASSLVVLCVPLLNYLVGLVGFCLVV